MLEISSQAYADFSCISQETWKLPVCANESVFRYIHVYVDDTPYSLKVEVQFRLRDSYHFPIASGLEIGRQEVFSSTWQLLEQAILTATTQDFSATVSESRSIFIQRHTSKHTNFSLWTKQFSRIHEVSV